MPLVAIARFVGQKVASRISFTAIDEGVDGRFVSDSGDERRVEMTAAINGMDEVLRMEMLEHRGEAPAFGAIRASGRKHKRVFDRNQSYGGRVDKHDYGYILPLLRQRLRAKVAGAAKREAYRGAWLGIVFDDNAALQSKRQSRFDPLCEQLFTRGNGIAAFDRAFCVGITGTYIFDSETLTGWLLPPLGR